MTRRRHICDVEGCARERKRWQRLCETCFGGLARDRDIRTGILEAHRLGQRGRKRQLCRRAGETLGLVEAPPPPPPTEPAPPPWWQRD